MMSDFLKLDRLTFTYDGAPQPILAGLTVQFPQGWTGIIGANGTGKTTLLRLACGLLTPDQGHVGQPGPAHYCPQRTDEAPPDADTFMQVADSLASRLRGQLGIDPGWLARWSTLSHGERKRFQIAAALWQQPAVLALDEPTNHLDAETRRLLLQALRAWPGIGLLVSHDRELLDALCRQCLMLEPPGAALRPGGYTQATALARAEREQARKEQAQARQELRRVEKMVAARAQEVAQARKKNSKRGIDPKDRDAKGRIDLGRLTGKDGKAGRLLSQLDGRLNQARTEAQRHQVAKETRLGVELYGERARRDRLLYLPAGALALGQERRLEYPDLCLMPEDRIALTGPNGTGKSTLIRHILEQLTLPPDKLLYLAQEIEREEARRILADVRALDRARLGEVMTCFCRLGSTPERLLQTDDPSPGELRKMLLALGITRRPQLIVMDEPTNHLDLPSIECLEQALEGCLCAVLLVSHDFPFLRRLTHTLWRIAPSADAAGADNRLTLRLGQTGELGSEIRMRGAQPARWTTGDDC